MRRVGWYAAVAAVTASVGVVGSSGTVTLAAGQHHLPGTQCTVFPADNVWRADISKLPVNSHNKQWMNSIGRGGMLHPDFGPAFGAQPVPYGIPITVVGRSHPRVKVKFGYGSESDHVRYPLGHDTKIEGGRHASGDRHALIVDKASCRLYETFATRKAGHRWKAASGATWSLKSNKLRPNHWTSADAAGLPIMPGLLRPDEVKAGHVDHAIRFTASVTSAHYLWPARHFASDHKSLRYPPMGARFRLKAGFSMKGYSRQARVVLRAMKTYGLILADNGSSWFFQGEASRKWHNKLISELKTIPANAFQAIDESSLQKSKHSGAVR
jgi:hypothetical protein